MNAHNVTPHSHAPTRSHSQRSAAQRVTEHLASWLPLHTADHHRTTSSARTPLHCTALHTTSSSHCTTAAPYLVGFSHRSILFTSVHHHCLQPLPSHLSYTAARPSAHIHLPLSPARSQPPALPLLPRHARPPLFRGCGRLVPVLSDPPPLRPVAVAVSRARQHWLQPVRSLQRAVRLLRHRLHHSARPDRGLCRPAAGERAKRLHSAVRAVRVRLPKQPDRHKHKQHFSAAAVRLQPAHWCFVRMRHDRCHWRLSAEPDVLCAALHYASEHRPVRLQQPHAGR